MKLYVITHWETGLLKEFSFAKGDTLRRFLISVSRLYALYPGSTYDQRVKIESTQKLNSVLADIDSDSDNLEILYVYPEDRSPTSSPTKGMSSPAGEEVDKSETFSTKSDRQIYVSRSTYQKRFKRELKRRDKSKCLLCSSVDALIGANIVDAEAKLSNEEKEALDMFDASDKYAVSNGLLLCANCHSMYDNWQLGVNDDGFLVKWVKDIGWVTDTAVNVYTDPSDKKSSPKNPLSILLKWKYDRFVSKRYKTSTMLYNGMRCLFSSPTKSTRK